MCISANTVDAIVKLWLAFRAPSPLSSPNHHLTPHYGAPAYNNIKNLGLINT